jgi:hypothetical protein
MTLPRLIVALALAAALVAGCGEEEQSTEPPVELEDQLGFSESGVIERQTRVENLIRDCMKAQGFDYVPVDPLAQQAALTGKAKLTDEEFLEQFGYGISTLFGRTSGSERASAPRTGRRTTARCGARTPGSRSQRRSIQTPRRSSGAAPGRRRTRCSGVQPCWRRCKGSSMSSRSASRRTNGW